MKKSTKNSSMKNDLILKMQINTLYSSFATFIENHDMPKLDIELLDWTDKLQSLNRIDFSTITPKGANRFLLKTLRQNKIILGYGFKAHYYHEFTHVLDFITIAQDLEIEQRRSYIKFYTEFHATQVALQTALGFERYNDNKQITLSDKLHVDNNAVDISNAQLLDVGEYMQRLTQKLSTDIPQWFDKYEQEKSEPLALKTLFSSLLNQSVYYFAKIDFMDKYCVEDTSSLFDTNLFVDSLGAEILQVYAVLNSGSIDKSKLDCIEALSQVILNNFFERMTGHKVPKT